MTETKAPYDARPIAVGDIVEWDDAWPYRSIERGTVTSLTGGGTHAIVTPDDGIGVACIALADLKRLTASAPTAPAASAFEVICTDYELALLQGNGSGIEG